ncbi:hypothetical protein [Desulfovibrio sp. JC010]|uniref:hypothetical protein n=1 Tax=Desulfovibrio sp. JC010 TaxID=2593641 RepID=UPI0013D4984E|nr:hypothetical protein [Desulfovibrio sp. JC010]NDV27560.1 hypothetical protein [Desulfovibrio sp. JC010]
MSIDENDIGFAKLLDVYCPEKFDTHLLIYAEGMLDYAKRLSRRDKYFNMSVWGIEDRAFGSLFLFPPQIVELIAKDSPLIANTKIAEFDMSHTAEISASELEQLELYRPIKNLLVIIATANDILEIYEQNKVAPRSLCSRLLDDVNKYHEWASKVHLSKAEIAVKDKGQSKKKYKSGAPKWFVSLCNHHDINPNQSAWRVWSNIKKSWSPATPLSFDIFEAIIHDGKLYYSNMRMNEKDWNDYVTKRKASSISYETFSNYLSDFKSIIEKS